MTHDLLERRGRTDEDHGSPPVACGPGFLDCRGCWQPLEVEGADDAAA